jgi:hypothetical protein
MTRAMTISNLLLFLYSLFFVFKQIFSFSFPFFRLQTTLSLGQEQMKVQDETTLKDLNERIKILEDKMSVLQSQIIKLQETRNGSLSDSLIKESDSLDFYYLQRLTNHQTPNQFIYQSFVTLYLNYLFFQQ